jgi:hypothetical protein
MEMYGITFREEKLYYTIVLLNKCKDLSIFDTVSQTTEGIWK